MQRNAEVAELLSTTGIVWPGAMDWLPRHRIKQPGHLAFDGRQLVEVTDTGTGKSLWGELDGAAVAMAMDSLMAQDATYSQPGLITSPSGGVPALLSTYIDPKMIEVILQPLKAELIYG